MFVEKYQFLFLSILFSIKIERLLFLKILKILAFFDSYFWPFNKTHEKIIAIFVISAIMVLICNVFIKFCWHDEKFTPARLSGWTEFNAKVLTYIIFFVNNCELDTIGHSLIRREGIKKWQFWDNVVSGRNPSGRPHIRR